MNPEQRHRCTVHVGSGGAIYLAFEPTSGAVSSYSNSLFTLDLRHDVTPEQAAALAEHINQRLWGVSATIF